MDTSGYHVYNMAAIEELLPREHQDPPHRLSPVMWTIHFQHWQYHHQQQSTVELRFDPERTIPVSPAAGPLRVDLLPIQWRIQRAMKLWHLPSSTLLHWTEVMSKPCKMALISCTMCNKKRTGTSIKTIE